MARFFSMFSLRQITCAGFMGVFPGCLLLSHNFARLPYMRGALIGVMFGALMQLVMMLLYLIVFSLVCEGLDDVLIQNNTTWLAIVAGFAVIQLLSAIGCRIMGSYFLYPGQAVTSFDRDDLLVRMKKLDTGKRSVVHDLVTEFERTPKPVARKRSWLAVMLVACVNLGVLIRWVVSVVRAFDPLWFEGRAMDAAWAFDLFLDVLWPFLILLGFGYVFLWHGIRQKNTCLNGKGA